MFNIGTRGCLFSRIGILVGISTMVVGKYINVSTPFNDMFVGILV